MRTNVAVSFRISDACTWAFFFIYFFFLFRPVGPGLLVCTARTVDSRVPIDVAVHGSGSDSARRQGTASCARGSCGRGDGPSLTDFRVGSGVGVPSTSHGEPVVSPAQAVCPECRKAAWKSPARSHAGISRSNQHPGVPHPCASDEEQPCLLISPAPC